MSATGRTNKDGPITERLEDDNYESPAWCVRAVWPHVRPVSGHVLEPCAGRGAIVEVLCRGDADKVLWSPSHVHAREIDQGREGRVPLAQANKMACDWLAFLEPVKPQLIITNPPYKHALEFASKAIAVQQPHGGTTCMLLRLNFLGSQKRGQWLRDHLPDVYVLSRRPSFVTYVTANRISESKPGWQAAGAAIGRWWKGLHATRVGLLPELAELVNDSGAKLSLAPSRVPAVQEWCARLPGWEGSPLVFKSGTDATEYAWFVWGPRARGRIHILEER